MTPFSTICSPFASSHENEQYAEWSIQHLLSLAGVVQRFGARQVEPDRPRQRQSRQRGREDRGVGAPPPRDEVAPYFWSHPTSGGTLLPVAPYFRWHPTSGRTLLPVAPYFWPTRRTFPFLSLFTNVSMSNVSASVWNRAFVIQ